MSYPVAVLPALPAITGHSASTGGSCIGQQIKGASFDQSGRLCDPDLCVSVHCRGHCRIGVATATESGSCDRRRKSTPGRTKKRDPLVGAVPFFSDRGHLESTSESAGRLRETHDLVEGVQPIADGRQDFVQPLLGPRPLVSAAPTGSRAKSSSAAGHAAGCSASNAVRPASARASRRHPAGRRRATRSSSAGSPRPAPSGSPRSARPAGPNPTAGSGNRRTPGGKAKSITLDSLSS